MTSIYIAGPVYRSDKHRPLSFQLEELVNLEMRFSAMFYEWIAEKLSDFVLSVPSPELDSYDPSKYFLTIADRIRSSDLFIGIYGRLSSGPPMEMAIASHFHKPIAIVAPESNSVPRLALGLPGLIGVFSLDELDRLVEIIRRGQTQTDDSRRPNFW